MDVRQFYLDWNENYLGFLHYWARYQLFTPSWWLALFLFIGGLVLFQRLLRKEDRKPVYASAAVTMLVVCMLDYIGTSLGIWYYKVHLFPLLPPFLLYDGVAVTINIQLFRLLTTSWLSRSAQTVIFAIGGASVGETIFEQLGFVDHLEWSAWYSLPFYAALYALSGAIVDAYSVEARSCPSGKPVLSGLLADAEEPVLLVQFSKKGEPLCYVDANQAACRILGYSRKELLKMNPSLISGASPQQVISWFQHVLLSKQSVKEMILRTRGGVEKALKVNFNVFEKEECTYVLMCMKMKRYSKGKLETSG
ncbi:PAS domain-containing protein [Paenibacillus turpanensis]|uniref:PAS domain-containing protein n=1 Tax=Paenibacillus turpanensis TaxID=2689078 RepID=UPI00140894C6|nr:PAS domain-containing protein [Paenibacillus turpanensis]